MIKIPAVGDPVPPRAFGPITRTDIVRYAGASGDFNPLHHDNDFAAGAGFPTVFSIGMLQAGLLATYVTDWLGHDGVERFAVQFREKVWPGDLLTCSGSVTSVECRDDGTRVVVGLSCCRGGDVVITGEVLFHLNQT